MHAWLKAIVWREMAFLKAENGDTWRVWFVDGQPMMERLPPDHDYTEALRW